jgi:hypothetical protein
LPAVRDSFLKKKLALTASEADLEGGHGTCARGCTRTAKCRVAFYYPLAEKFGKLGDFH